MYEEDFDNLECQDVAIRLRHEFNLFHAVEREFKKNSEEKKTYPKGYERFKIKKIMRNLKNGIKEIERKNPLYVEMPRLESVGNGQVKKTYDENFKDKPTDVEIDVYETLPQSNKPSGLIDN